MNTPQQLFFYTNYKAIESEIINDANKDSDKSKSAKQLFHQQIEGLDKKIVLEYIDYIKRQEMSFYNGEGLRQLKNYLPSIEYKIKLSTPPPLHFTQSFTQEQLQLLYTGLIEGEFLPTNADKKAFDYVFGCNDKQEDFNLLEWIGMIRDLNAFINVFYNGERAKWKKTVSCFKWENKLINENSLKTANDSYDEDPPSKTYFASLKKKIAI